MFSVNGRTLTITRIDPHGDEDEGWDIDFCLRAYLPMEDIPDFTSTVYTYWGLFGERAPQGTTELIFHPSVTTIKRHAFKQCGSLVRVSTMPDTVTRIEIQAFFGCDSLRSIRLSTNLVFIGEWAFLDCSSLDGVFLPPTVTHIGDHAFGNCKSLRFFHVPDTIEHLGDHVVHGCHGLLASFNFNGGYNYNNDEVNHWFNGGYNYNNDEVNQWLMQRHANFPFHQACSSTHVSSQGIEGCIQEHRIERGATDIDDRQMTALHILCANPHVTGDCIRSYLQLAPEAANQEDSEGMTPFQYLCRSDIIFFDERNFSSLVAWWYGCMS